MYSCKYLRKACRSRLSDKRFDIYFIRHASARPFCSFCAYVFGIAQTHGWRHSRKQRWQSRNTPRGIGRSPRLHRWTNPLCLRHFEVLLRISFIARSLSGGHGAPTISANSVAHGHLTSNVLDEWLFSFQGSTRGFYLSPDNGHFFRFCTVSHEIFSGIEFPALPFLRHA